MFWGTHGWLILLISSTGRSFHCIVQLVYFESSEEQGFSMYIHRFMTAQDLKDKIKQEINRDAICFDKGKSVYCYF